MSINCPHIHCTRLEAVIDVATGLQKNRNLSLTAIGRQIDSDIAVKHRIKKVDRLLSNKHLYDEISSSYKGLSAYILTYIQQAISVPLIVDLCYMKDTHAIQMLSAEVALKGRSLPIYREVFKERELKNRASKFIEALSSCIPAGKEVLIIMNAGFGEDWFDAIAEKGWYWLVRARGKNLLNYLIRTTELMLESCTIQQPLAPSSIQMHTLQKNHREPVELLLKAFLIHAQNKNSH